MKKSIFNHIKKFAGKIKTQVLVSMIMLTVLITLTLSMTLFWISKNLLQRVYQNFNMNNIIAYSQMLDLRSQNLIHIIRDQTLQPELLYLIEQRNNFSASAYRDGNTTVKILSSLDKLISSDSLFSSVALFDVDGYAQITSNLTGNTMDFQYRDKNSALHESWFQSAIAEKGKEIFWGSDVLNPYSKHKISIIKLLNNTYSFQPVGVLVITVDKSFVSSLMDDWNINQKTYSLKIVDPKQNNMLIYSRGDQDSYKGKSLHMGYTNYSTGWRIESCILEQALSQDYLYIRSTAVILIISIFLLSICISWLISSKINRPLKHLSQAIEHLGTTSEKMDETFKNGEIGDIGNFLQNTVNSNLMLHDKLHEANIKEKEAQLLLLQSQINPHFLYNTLDSLYSMAIIHGTDDVADMVAALSEMFRLSLNEGKKVIKLKEELNYIKKYMHIQNIRYNNKFNLLINIDDSLENIYILKFLIQPFVENAVYHGLELKMGKGTIEIDCQIHSDLIIIIRDDGIGIKDVKNFTPGYGIQNVKERIRLFYGDSYGIFIKNRCPSGTEIEIKIPAWNFEHYQDIMQNLS